VRLGISGSGPDDGGSNPPGAIILFMSKGGENKMAPIRELESEIKQIKERNKRVEADKAWETSWARKIIIALLTYIVIVLFFFAASLPKPFINSIVPAAAFVLSTLTLPIFKKLWLKINKK
jgi:hypothetical protein